MLTKNDRGEMELSGGNLDRRPGTTLKLLFRRSIQGWLFGLIQTQDDRDKGPKDRSSVSKMSYVFFQFQDSLFELRPLYRISCL